MVSYVIFHGGTNNVVNKMAKQLEKRKLFVIQLADKWQKNLEKTSCAHVSSQPLLVGPIALLFWLPKYIQVNK